MLTSGPTEKILWGIILVVVTGYLVGSYLNRQRSRRLGTWLASAISEFGGKARWQFRGGMTSGGQATVEGASYPFTQLHVAYMLMTREFAPLWAIEHLRGNRDLLAIRGHLRDDLVPEFEILPMDGDLRRKLDRHSLEQPWTWTAAPHGFGIATRSSAAAARIPSVVAFLEQYGTSLRRLSLRKRRPNLVVFFALAGLEKLPSKQLIRALKTLTRDLCAPVSA